MATPRPRPITTPVIVSGHFIRVIPSSILTFLFWQVCAMMMDVLVARRHSFCFAHFCDTGTRSGGRQDLCVKNRFRFVNSLPQRAIVESSSRPTHDPPRSIPAKVPPPGSKSGTEVLASNRFPLLRGVPPVPQSLQ